MPKPAVHKTRQCVTSFDVAKEAGVSRTTVSLVLNNAAGASISAETANRVRLAADRLSYRPNVAAKSITTSKAYSFGLISCWDASSPLFARPVQGMIKSAREAGYGLTLCDLASHNLDKSIAVALDFYREGRIDGIVALMRTRMHTEPASPLLAELRSNNIPFVLVNANTADPSINDICADNFHAGYLAAEHLLRLGHTQIAFIGRRTESGVSYATTERLRGYLAALRAAGVTPQDDLHIRVEGSPTPTESAYRVFQQYLKKCSSRPTALYAINDHFAIGALYAAQDLGIQTPDELAIVGTDDLDVAAQIRPALTSVRQPLELMGEEAVKALLRLIDGEERMGTVKLALPCRLIVRESCGGRCEA